MCSRCQQATQEHNKAFSISFALLDLVLEPQTLGRLLSTLAQRIFNLFVLFVDLRLLKYSKNEVHILTPALLRHVK